MIYSFIKSPISRIFILQAYTEAGRFVYGINPQKFSAKQANKKSPPVQKGGDFTTVNIN